MPGHAGSFTPPTHQKGLGPAESWVEKLSRRAFFGHFIAFGIRVLGTWTLLASRAVDTPPPGVCPHHHHHHHHPQQGFFWGVRRPFCKPPGALLAEPPTHVCLLPTAMRMPWSACPGSACGEVSTKLIPIHTCAGEGQRQVDATWTMLQKMRVFETAK